MIKKIILPLIAIVLLSSCANKFSLVKRKYNKGYHFDISHKKTSEPKNNNLALAKEKKNTKDLSNEEPVANEIAATVYAGDNEIKAVPVAIQTENKKDAFVKHKPVASAEAKKDFSKNTFKPVAVKQSQKQQKGAKASSDGELIIMVILCLFPFINLIPVYMHDGKDITLNFWLTLILDILFFLPGIIYALLVVLDVFSAA